MLLFLILIVSIIWFTKSFVSSISSYITFGNAKVWLFYDK